MRNTTRNRTLAYLLAAGTVIFASAPGFAQDPTSLFEVVTVKDQIVIALSAKDIETVGGNDVTAIGQAIKAKGELTVWQYAVRKGTDGQLEQAPLKRVSLLGADSLRVKPYSASIRVVPAPEE